MASLVRPRLSGPIRDSTTCQASVCFRHPGYKDDINQLLLLPVLDSGGIDYDTAHTACAILAGNRWDGLLAEKANGEGVAVLEDRILRKQYYYFHVSNDPNGKCRTSRPSTTVGMIVDTCATLTSLGKIPYSSNLRPLALPSRRSATSMANPVHS